MFSERYGFRAEKRIMLKTVSDTLRTRIWNLFYMNEIKKGGLASKRISTAFIGELTIEDKVADKLGIDIADLNAQNILKRFLINNCKWNEVYDFIEIYLSFVSEDCIDEITSSVNNVLEEEKSGYRVINRCVTPITNKMELHEVNKAISSKYEPVNIHLKNALELYSDITNPDYNNSIKESISAVESLCCIITNNPKATLGQALKVLEENGIHIHKAMVSGFNNLYGYTSDENGIRHGGIDFINSPAEDARYMLVSCSAFINYLIEKYEVKQNRGSD